MADVSWSGVRFEQLPRAVLEEFKVLLFTFEIRAIVLFARVHAVGFQALENPSPEDFDIGPDVPTVLPSAYRWYGGETRALQQLTERLDHERDSFVSGFYLPNRANPDLLGPPTSLSAALRYGCLSIRK